MILYPMDDLTDSGSTDVYIPHFPTKEHEARLNIFCALAPLSFLLVLCFHHHDYEADKSSCFCAGQRLSISRCPFSAHRDSQDSNLQTNSADQRQASFSPRFLYTLAKTI